MRKLLLSFAPAALALVALIACEDDSNSGGPSLNLDSGAGDFDASTPPFDGSVPDSAQPDAAPTTIGVTLVGANSAPLANVDIVFHGADGAVIEAKKTDANGKASHVGGDAKMVSALLADGNYRQIVTWTGVELGDDLQLKDDRAGNGSVDRLGIYQVTLPGEYPSAFQYYIDGPCNTSQTYGTSAMLSLYAHCARGKNAVIARATTNGQSLAYTFKKGVDGITDGGNASVILGDWQQPTPFNLTISNLPVEPAIDPELAAIADGALYFNAGSTTEDGYATNVFNAPSGFADAYQATVHNYGDNGASRILTKRLAASASSVAFDYNTFLPTLNQATINAADPRRPVFHIGADGSLASTDGGLVQFSFNGTDDANYAWLFVVPPGTTDFTAPAMPAGLDSFLPYAADSGQEAGISNPEVTFIEADIILSAAAFRQQGGSLLGYVGRGFASYSFEALPADGTYKATSWTPNFGLKAPRKPKAPVTE